MGETLQDILTRLEARLFEVPAGTSPASPASMDTPMVSPGHMQTCATGALRALRSTPCPLTRSTPMAHAAYTAVLTGPPVPLRPAPRTLEEWRTILPPDVLDPAHPDSPLHCYHEAHGYRFAWGQVLEGVGAPAADGPLSFAHQYERCPVVWMRIEGLGMPHKPRLRCHGLRRALRPGLQSSLGRIASSDERPCNRQQA
jgi:hypothetical protein